MDGLEPRIAGWPPSFSVLLSAVPNVDLGQWAT